jgi:hypothetical protein
VSAEALDRARRIAAQLPPEGLFQGMTWRITPDPLPLNAGTLRALEHLGPRLAAFLRACALLYRMSADGRQPAWIAELLDRGKPPGLIALQREKCLAAEIPAIIRPDIILTDGGFVIVELDSVPGGIGLTAWLAEAHAASHPQVLGGHSGMLDGFAAVFPGGDILVSEEAATYRPEMEWLAARLNETRDGHWRVLGTEARDDLAPRIYRFFELFDLPNIAAAPGIIRRLRDGSLTVTPPFKPALEEKLWFALFWLRPLDAFWRRALGDRTFHALRAVIPQTWLVDPQPLPPHAVLPGLDVHAWDEVARFSQKQRDLILKISGFSDKAWGSRGVALGSDMPSAAWQNALQSALGAWNHSPHILQRFHHARLVHHRFLDPTTNSLSTLRGKVRLCPYYFVRDPRTTTLGGALATICPDNKKLLHGMPDAIITTAEGPSDLPGQ